MERNSAVYQLVRAWADYLQGEDTLFKSRDERILFGSLLTVDADAAIDEKAWLPPPDPPAPAPADSGLLAGLWDLPVMKAHVIDEPELEFRARNRHIDPRYGVAVHGPADADAPSAPRDIPVGLVGPLRPSTACAAGWNGAGHGSRRKRPSPGRRTCTSPSRASARRRTSAPGWSSMTPWSARSPTGSSACSPRPT